MEKDISNFCFEAHEPNDIPFAIDMALNNFEVSKIKLKNTENRMFFKLDGSAAMRARDIILSYKNQ